MEFRPQVVFRKRLEYLLRFALDLENAFDLHLLFVGSNESPSVPTSVTWSSPEAMPYGFWRETHELEELGEEFNFSCSKDPTTFAECLLSNALKLSLDLQTFSEEPSST